MEDDGAGSAPSGDSGEHASPRARPGRVCKEPGCGTRLSVYNDQPYCGVHAPMITPRTRGRKLSA